MITQPLLGRRFFAGLVDYGIIYGFFMAYILFFGEPNEEGEYGVTGVASLVPVLFWFIMTIGLEQLTGATLGNGIAGLKPMDISGKNKPDFFQSLKRHLLDVVDMFFFGLVAIISIKNSPKHQRLGDQWAKTIVVKS